MATIAKELDYREESRFNALMQETYRKVYNLAFRLAGNKLDAEDLTQEAFYRAYRSFPDYEGDKPFENWIFRIVTRLFLDLLRARKRRVQAMSYDAPLQREGSDDTVFFDMADQSPSAEQILLGGSFSEELQAALDALSEEQRTLITLADIEQMPYKDIAAIMGKPVGTIRSRLHRAHKQLRARVEAARKCREKSCGCGMRVCTDLG
ncbi:MAG: sigma-70 family RNA polymerase sigma factor [Armatimonadetes bacterium]|nr:sigma-70 family RNA polymerase sigma factor [Armatimonadota bacterium]